MSRFALVTLAVLFAARWAAGQNVSSSVNGTLVDPTGAAIPGATCMLTRQGTGAVLTVISGTGGLFTFPNVAPGTYTLAVQQAGFKALEVKDIAVTSSEVRS